MDAFTHMRKGLSVAIVGKEKTEAVSRSGFEQR